MESELESKIIRIKIRKKKLESVFSELVDLSKESLNDNCFRIISKDVENKILASIKERLCEMESELALLEQRGE